MIKINIKKQQNSHKEHLFVKKKLKEYKKKKW